MRGPAMSGTSPAGVPAERVGLTVVWQGQVQLEFVNQKIGDPGHPDFFFCGGQAITGLPYCAYHSRVAYQPAHMRRDRRPFRG